MVPKNVGLEDDFPLSNRWCSRSMLVSGVYEPSESRFSEFRRMNVQFLKAKLGGFWKIFWIFTPYRGKMIQFDFRGRFFQLDGKQSTPTISSIKDICIYMFHFHISHELDWAETLQINLADDSWSSVGWFWLHKPWSPVDSKDDTWYLGVATNYVWVAF